jgi:hypothetical protein
MMGGIGKRNSNIGYAAALESEFRSTTDCREDIAESRVSVDLVKKYTDGKLKIQATSY